MKKIYKNWLTGLVVCGLLAVTMVVAVPQAEASDPVVVVNGERIFPNVNPYINSRNVTMVEMRSIFEALDCTLDYNSADKTIFVVAPNGGTLLMEVGNRNVVVDGEWQTMASAPEVWYGRSLVPLRFISENLGATVSWDKSTDVISVDTY